MDNPFDHDFDESQTFYVEIKTGQKDNGGFDCWAIVESWLEAEEEAQTIVDHGFEYRIMDAEDRTYSIKKPKQVTP